MDVGAIAVNRFGYGLRSQDALPADPKRWLLDQLDRFDPRPSTIAAVPTTAQIVRALGEYQQAIIAERKNRLNMPAGDQSMTEKVARRAAVQAAVENYITMLGARTSAAVASDTPFMERLTHFWANHFAVSTEKFQVAGLAGTMEFDAIRPNLLGSFHDLVLAVERHPAMLLYLDQAQSVGANSTIGARVAARGVRKVGLNENLAREIMELHTLGVRTGYTQADVTEFAKALTGWTVAGLRGGAQRRMIDDEAPGSFLFVEEMHEPGDRTIMGKRYKQDGVRQAAAIIDDLTRSPATARHVATKLARHFTGDTPPSALVSNLAEAYQKTNGNLPSLYRVLIESRECWSPAPAKFKSPWDWTVSALRAVNLQSLNGAQIANLTKQLGQPIWRPGSPAGFDDIDAAWAGPDAIMKRVDAAARLADRAGPSADVRALAARVLAGSAGPDTLTAISRCASPVEGAALMLVAPEFMRR